MKASKPMATKGIAIAPTTLRGERSQSMKAIAMIASKAPLECEPSAAAALSSIAAVNACFCQFSLTVVCKKRMSGMATISAIANSLFPSMVDPEGPQTR